MVETALNMHQKMTCGKTETPVRRPLVRPCSELFKFTPETPAVINFTNLQAKTLINIQLISMIINNTACLKSFIVYFGILTQRRDNIAAATRIIIKDSFDWL